MAKSKRKSVTRETVRGWVYRLILTLSFAAPAHAQFISNLNPSSGSPGQTLNVIVTGDGTHFQQGVSVADFGPDITVNTLTVQSATQLTVNLTISLNQPTGGQVMKITTGAEVAFNNFNIVGDTTPPTVGGGGTITTSNVLATSLTLNWTKASDSVSSQSTLQYEVRRSSSNNMSTVTNAENNGTIAQVYTTDIATANISGLTASTTYFFTVIVKDQAGIKAVYTTVSATTTAPPDTVAPVPGNSGTITPSNIATTTLTLTWTKATDAVSAQSVLQYEVRRSTSNNIGTLANAKANGTIAQAYTTNIATANLTGLTPSTTYFFNVIVKDAAGNEAVYTTATATTTADTVAPAPGNSGTITPSNIATTALTLTWTKATDAVSAQSVLQYEVRRSTSNNIATLANAKANGTIAQAYTTDIATANLTGLAPSTAYFFNVIVKDAAGNEAVYTTATATTAADTVAPAPGNSGTITTSNIATTTLTLTWTKATDAVSAQAALQYEVRRSTSNNIATLANAKANGTIAQAYTTDIATANLTGLAPSTAYFFNVIVKDAAGNEAVYTTATATTTADSVAPAPGGGGTISTSGITSSTLTLTWTKATDAVSAQSVLQYELRRSTSNNIGTVPNAEANGTIVQAYTTDIATANATGLTASTTYFFNVIVKDAAGNKAVYTTATATTAAPVKKRRGQITSN